MPSQRELGRRFASEDAHLDQNVKALLVAGVVRLVRRPRSRDLVADLVRDCDEAVDLASRPVGRDEALAVHDLDREEVP